MKPLILAPLRTALAAGAFLALVLSAGAARAQQPDAWVTAKIKLELELVNASSIDVNAVHVDTVDGRVTLYGKVPSSAQKERAAQVARRFTTRGVRNLLQVVPPAEARVTYEADDILRYRLAKRFKQEPLLTGTRIAVKSIDRGVVLLTGNARNLTEYLCAVETASGVPGVRSVASEVMAPNELAASGAKRIEKGLKHDSWVTLQTKMQLMADRMVPALDVNVETRDGTVTLFGVVPSNAARLSAVTDTRKVDAALMIDDQLQVVPASRHEEVAVRDDQIEREVRGALHNQADLRGVDATVRGGVARLTGFVSSDRQRLDAATIARSVPGVRAVEDDLRL